MGEWQDGRDAATIRDVSTFMESLRQLKARAGLSYRQLEDRAAAVGDVLPRSSVAGMLSGERLPRPALLAAFVRACGDGDRVGEWAETRDRLAGEHGAVPPAAAPLAHPSSSGTELSDQGRRAWWSRPPWRHLTAVTVVVAVVVGVFTALLRSSSEPHTQVGSFALPEASHPEAVALSGWVTIRVADDPGLCLTDGRVRDWRYTPLVAVQRPCDATAPQATALEPVGEGTYRIQWHHPDYGKGCLKALTSGSGAGLLEPQDDCADGSIFSLEPSGRLELGRYVLRVEGQGCVGIRADSTAEGAEAVMQRCKGKGRQVFLVRAVKPAGGSGSTIAPSTRDSGK